jgi:hypothetical protein
MLVKLQCVPAVGISAADFIDGTSAHPVAAQKFSLYRFPWFVEGTATLNDRPMNPATPAAMLPATHVGKPQTR